jgi:hypothetical protein
LGPQPPNANAGEADVSAVTDTTTPSSVALSIFMNISQDWRAKRIAMAIILTTGDCEKIAAKKSMSPSMAAAARQATPSDLWHAAGNHRAHEFRSAPSADD